MFHVIEIIENYVENKLWFISLLYFVRIRITGVDKYGDTILQLQSIGHSVLELLMFYRSTKSPSGLSHILKTHRHSSLS